MTEASEAVNTISVADFLQQPQDVTAYKSGEKVTRANFIPFLIRSFEISRGEPIWQYIYFSWVQERTGFDWKGTLANLLDAGVWECLSDKERKMFIGAYNKVPSHENTAENFPANPQEVFYTQIKAFVYPESLEDVNIKKRYQSLGLNYKGFKYNYGVPKTEKDLIKALNRFGKPS